MQTKIRYYNKLLKCTVNSYNSICILLFTGCFSYYCSIKILEEVTSHVLLAYSDRK